MENDARSLSQSIMRDLKSLKALWNYLFLSLYVFISVWLTLYHADACGNAVVYTTGGIVTAVFTNYCWAHHMDRRLDAENPTSQPVTGATHTSKTAGFPAEAPGDDNG